MSIKNCHFGGKIVNLNVWWDNDVPRFAATGLNTAVPIEFKKGTFSLNPVTDINNKRIIVPKSLGGELPLPEEFAAYALNWLKALGKALGFPIV